MRQQSDTRVPFTGAHGRYLLLNETPSWIYHTMASSNLDGNLPRTASTVPTETDPSVRCGRADYNNLTQGGLFSILAQYKKPFVVESIDKAGAVVVTLVDQETGVSRAAPTTFPFQVGVNEVIKAVGGTKIGVLVREDLPYR